MFRLHLALGVTGVVATAGAVVAAVVSVHRQAAGAHHLVIAGQQLTYPTINVAAAVLLALAGVGVWVIVGALRACWSQGRAYRGFVGQLRVIGPLPGYPAVSVIDDDQPQAFCAGYLRPKIYVSRGALDVLSGDELRAVLLHEHHHREVRDPLRLACARVLSQSVFFLPILRRLSDRYSDLAELTADAAAVRASGGEKRSLASALLAFDANAHPGVAGISPERVDSLLGEPVQWRVPSALVACTLAGLSALVVVVWRASQAASAHATFNLPVLSSQPCMLVLALLPLLACLALLVGRRRLFRPTGAPGFVRPSF
jgi:hypothetical protein